MYGVDGQLLSRPYKNHLSDYRQWDQQYHAHQYVLYKQNIGERLSMDETCLSQGELYTIITNKAAKRGKGSLVAMIKGTKSCEVVRYLSKLPRSKRLQVQEITIDLSPSMKLIAKQAFPIDWSTFQTAYLFKWRYPAAVTGSVKAYRDQEPLEVDSQSARTCRDTFCGVSPNCRSI